MGSLIYELIVRLGGLGQWLYDFCTTTIKVGTFEINILILFGGVGLSALVIAGLVKAIVPLL